ncbi:MAG: hypothetical protein U0936_01060 [Planctomycetaceae bacterium]
MSNREAKSQARQWVESPVILAEDLRRRLDYIKANVFEATDSESDSSRNESVVVPEMAAEVLAILEADDSALWEYRRLVPETRVKYRMLQPLIEVLREVVKTRTSLQFSGVQEIEDAVIAVGQWAKRQAFRAAEIPLRSDLLRTTIEQLGDELIVRTDQDGSIKLRGTVNIPMFLAFWRAPKHRLSNEAFLEIDPGSKHTYLERHRTRLCSQLQDILLELVVDGNGVRLQRCRK